MDKMTDSSALRSGVGPTTPPDPKNSTQGSKGGSAPRQPQPDLREHLPRTMPARPDPQTYGGSPDPGSGAFVLRVRRTVPLSPRSQPSSAAPGVQTGSIPLSGGAPSSASGTGPVGNADAGLNNCSAPDVPEARVRPLPANLPDSRVFAADLGPKILSMANAALGQHAVLSPESVGELLVAVECKGGKLGLEGDRVRRIFREGLTIHDFQPLSSEKPLKLNLIETVSKPFMQRHLVTEDLESLRRSVWKVWLKVAPDDSVGSQGGPSAEVLAQRDEAIRPVIDMICGTPPSFSNSQLPAHLKRLLLSIDKNIIQWFEKNGSGQMKDLFSARRSALIVFLSTRSLGYVWLEKLVEENRHDLALCQSATQMIQHLNSHVATRIDDFLLDVMRSQLNQPPAVANYAKLLTGERTLKVKPGLPASSPDGDVGSSWDRMLSPRALARPSEGKAARDRDVEGRLARAKYADELARCVGLVQLDYGCYQHIKQKLVELGQRGFDNVRRDPVRYVLKYAAEFYASADTSSSGGVRQQVEKAIGSLTPGKHPQLFLSTRDEDAPSEERPVRTGPASPARVHERGNSNSNSNTNTNTNSDSDSDSDSDSKVDSDDDS